MMTDLPDFTKYGYQINTELGRNREGGRITWKGRDLAEDRTVIIKQFCFATSGSSWSGYNAYQQEIKILQKLKHPGIPNYLNSFATESGFCLIQEYKKAAKLSDLNGLNLAEIKKIVIEALEILVYLQQQKPPILHLDIKPENILVDDTLNVYLIDFGFAILGSKEVSISSVFKGTPGFIPPEQIIKPTTASDLYSLGVTTICLLTNKSSSQINESIDADNPYRLEFKAELPQLNRAFINWLDKMVQPQASKRFPNALTAKNALEPIDLTVTNIVIADKLKSFSAIDLKTNRGIFFCGTGSIALLSSMTVWAINFTRLRIDSNIMTIATAITIAVVVTITEVANLTVAISEDRDLKFSLILSVAIPVLLVAIASLCFGKSLAIASSSAILVSQILCLAYFLRKKLPYYVISLFAAIVLGITLGLKTIF